MQNIASKLVNDCLKATVTSKLLHVLESSTTPGDSKISISGLWLWILSFNRRLSVLSNLGEPYICLKTVELNYESLKYKPRRAAELYKNFLTTGMAFTEEQNLLRLTDSASKTSDLLLLNQRESKNVYFEV